MYIETFFFYNIVKQPVKKIHLLKKKTLKLGGLVPLPSLK